MNGKWWVENLRPLALKQLKCTINEQSKLIWLPSSSRSYVSTTDPETRTRLDKGLCFRTTS